VHSPVVFPASNLTRLDDVRRVVDSVVFPGRGTLVRYRVVEGGASACCLGLRACSAHNFESGIEWFHCAEGEGELFRFFWDWSFAPWRRAVRVLKLLFPRGGWDGRQSAVDACW